MALSGTYDFNPSLGDIVIGAFARCGIRRTQLTQQHMQDAQFEANMLQSEFQGDGLQTWQVFQENQDLIAGKGVYDVDPRAIYMLDLWIRQYPEQPNATDRLLLPISRSDWAATANKNMQGFPTSYWYDRLIPSKLYLWPVPNMTVVNGLQYFLQIKPDDAALQNGTQVDIPYAVYDYYTWCLAERLAFIYAPEKVNVIAPRKAQAYTKYVQATTENVPIRMEVQMRGYYR